jgi:hypothetical protein
MESDGGTQLWCPKCDEIQECKVISYDNDSKGNFFHKEFPDLQWRARPRQCNVCDHHFNTYEIEQTAIDELVELRKLLIELKTSIELQEQFPTKILKFINLPSEN